MNGVPFPSPPRRISLITAVVLVAALFLARDFFIPLVLAILISFLLAPVVRRFEKWHMGRIGSVIVACVLAFSVIGAVGYVVAGQLIDLANRLPEYKTNLRAKVVVLKPGGDGPLVRAKKTIDEITEEIKEPKDGAATPVAKRAATTPAPVAVEVVDRAGNAFELLRDFLVSLLAPLGVAAVVAVFVVFMLLEREDLRDRFIHLIGQGRLHLTTQALDDAGRRVSRYLLAQFVVNVSYGLPIGLGLHFIGVPNAILWGILATILRYIPYIGAWIAASFPVVLSLAISPGWVIPMLTIGLFILMEIVSNNVVEPWLYGASTGLSPMAVIVSAVFWTWLWGVVGLLLATPLTVCLAVLGKYIPSLSFLDVLLGKNPPIVPSDRLYQRLLALDEEEAVEIVEQQIEVQSLAHAFNRVLLPAIALAESDCRAEVLDEAKLREMFQLVRRLLAGLDENGDVPAAPQVVCLPASSEADELIALMLAHLLRQRGVAARTISSKSLASEMVEQVEDCRAPVLVISALPPASVMPATYLTKRLRARVNFARIVIGLWQPAEREAVRRTERLKRAQADEVFTQLDKAAAEIALLAGLTLAPAKSAA